MTLTVNRTVIVETTPFAAYRNLIDAAQATADAAQARPYAKRVLAEAAIVPAPVNRIGVKTPAGDTLWYKRDATGTALTTGDGANWSPDGGVFAEHFGSVGDGDEANATANLAAFTASLTYLGTLTADTENGASLRFKGRHVVSGPVVVDAERIALLGVGGAGATVAASEIRGHGVNGPVLRVKGRHPILKNFVVSATNTRRAASAVTRDNYAGLGLTRDDQNYGIWIEADDNGTDFVDEIGIENVWVHNQPNTSWAIMGGGYNSRIERSGSNDSNRHGLVIGDGKFTGRTNLRIAGVMTISDWSSRGSQGHGFVVGDPTDVGGLAAVRILVHSMDNYNNGKNQTYLFDNYDTWMVADNSVIVDSAFNGNGASDATYPGQNGAVAVGGRTVLMRNTRLMNVGDGQAPVKIIATHGTGTPRASDGVVFDEGTLSLSADATGPLAHLVDNTGNIAGLEVYKRTLEGNASALVNGSFERGHRADVEYHNGTVLMGKTAVDTTTPGILLASDGSGGQISVVRNNITAFFDRTGSGENVRFLRSGTAIGQIYTDAGSVGLAAVTGKEAFVSVTGGRTIRVKSNTINTGGLPTSSAGLSGGDWWVDAGTLKIVP